MVVVSSDTVDNCNGERKMISVIMISNIQLVMFFFLIFAVDLYFL